MPEMSGNTHKRKAEEPFRNNFRNFHTVKLLAFLFRQNTLDCPAQGSYSLATKSDCPDLTGQVEKVPIRTLNVSGQRRAIKILDDFPARQEGFTFDRQVRRQRRAFLDENGHRSIDVWHLC